MDLKQLDYFVHVAELGSFSKAASLLSTAQSALSHKVRQLEVELKQTLLHRNGRGVTPTEAGKRLLVHARGILMQVARTHDQLAELGQSPSGHLSVGLPATMGKLLTLPLVKAFRSGFPNASIGIMEGLSASIVEWVSTGRVDIGMVFNPAPSPAIEITPVHEEPMYLVSRLPARGARTLPLKELPNHPLIIPSRPNANRMRIEAQLAYFGLKPSIAFEVDGITSLLDILWVAVLGPALALVPAAVLDRDAGGTVRPTLFPLALSALDPFLWECARNSVAVALGVTLISLVLGIGLARVVVRWRFWGRPILAVLTLATLVVPPLFGAIGLRRLASTLPAIGWLIEGAASGWVGWVWVELASGIPLVALATAAALVRSDPAWEDAARLAGATDRQVWWQLVWPGVRPSAARAASAVFTLTLIEPGAPLVLGLRRTLAFQIVDAALGPEPAPRAAVLAVVAVAFAGLARGLFRWWGRGSGLGEVSLDQPITRASVARWPRAAWYTTMLGLAAILAWVPIVALLATAFSDGLDLRRLLSLDLESQRVLLNSLALGLTVVAIDLALGWTLAAWAGRRAIWILSLAAWPELLPPLALGVGALVLPEVLQLGADWARNSAGPGAAALAGGAGFLAAALDGYRTPGVLLALAVAAARLPFQARAVEYGWSRFRPMLVDAAISLGARPRQALGTATGLWLGAAPSALFLTFALAATNVAPALVLAPTIESRPLAPAILILTDEPGPALARASTFAAVAVTVNLAALALAATRRSVHLGDWFGG